MLQRRMYEERNYRGSGVIYAELDKKITSINNHQLDKHTSNMELNMLPIPCKH